MIHYQSTRGSKYIKTSAQAIIQGIAEDQGLYVPNEIPKLPFKIEEIVGKPYKDVAFRVLKAFLEDYTDEELQRCIDGAYDSKFEEEKIVPVIKGGEAYFLELYHGKTAAFKDMALSILPYLLTTAMKKEKEDRKVCILTATSGDTGKAALEGFADVPGTEIVVFYPNQGVSQVQERQMVTQEGKNTHVFAINGNFDDAQTGVKKIFSDDAFGKELAGVGVTLSSANSINIGRLIPQVAYYVYGYANLIEQGVIDAGDKINVVVPTGNFGNILAAYYAGQMGIPVKKFICASNENKVLTDFINTGTYNLNREFYMTNSPSMDILISSNLERLLYHLSGGNGEEIKDLMGKLEIDRKYTVSPKIKYALDDFYGGFADMERTNETIGELYRKHGYLIDTHTAVAYRVYEDYVAYTGDKTPALVASTASAYKFADSVCESIGIGKGADGFDSVRKLAYETSVRIPAGLKDLDKKEIRHKGVLNIDEMPQAVRDSVE
ncbi:MAG: threonine synthase [Eubacteriaceae bacterium]|nr:threonine synthase [Eubacteriaceae bacterium]